jgi:hypothetical protein
VSATDRAAKLWHSIEAWVRDSVAYAGCPPSDEHHFLISAAYAEPDAFLRRLGTIWADPEWRRYAVDRPVIAQIAQRVRDEVQRLRAAVLGPISAAQAAVIKHANQRRELEENAARLRVHYDLEVWLTLLERACDPTYQQRVMAEAVPEEYRAQVCRRLALTRKSEVELADGLLAERVEHWPILRVVYWPLSWLARRLGRGLARAPQARASVADPFRFSARGLADHFRLLRAQIRDDHARVVQRFSLADQFPEPEQLAAHASAACETLVNDLDRQTLVGLRESYRKPSAWKRGLLWLVLLWFPLIQPVADGLLAIAGSDGALMSLRGLHQLVAVLGAGPLLRGLLLVLAIYVACLAAMYARCIRDVRQARQRPDESGPGPSGVELALLEELDRILTEEVAAPLARPMLALYERLAERTTQLAAFARRAN